MKYAPRFQHTTPYNINAVIKQPQRDNTDLCTQRSLLTGALIFYFHVFPHVHTGLASGPPPDH